ncbi:hypothetical protein BTZ20_0756 [Rhodococcus sp. MTM3W5.2]|nr:hypothetical protein BTZ20_0756 [Rhodococcus sp. MTM3W5.2]
MHVAGSLEHSAYGDACAATREYIGWTESKGASRASITADEFMQWPAHGSEWESASSADRAEFRRGVEDAISGTC